MRDSSSSSGSFGMFAGGLIAALAGVYLFLQNVQVLNGFGLGYSFYRFNAFGSSFGLTSGGMLLPLILGIGMLFYDSKSLFARVLTGGSFLAIVGGVLLSLNFSLRSMSMLDLLLILTLVAGGLGTAAKNYKAR